MIVSSDTDRISNGCPSERVLVAYNSACQMLISCELVLNDTIKGLQQQFQMTVSLFATVTEIWR